LNRQQREDIMKKAYGISLVLAVFVLASCFGDPAKPDWIKKGAGAFGKEKKVLYGVGIAEGIRSEALRRTTADNRAIAEISKQLSTMSTSIMRDYMSSANVTEQEKSAGDQYVENTVKTFSSNTLAGAKIMDRRDNGKVCYSLATLNIDDLKVLAEKVKELRPQVREYIKDNAEQAFDKMEAEQAKMQ
jgi:hypothetical protein